MNSTRTLLMTSAAAISAAALFFAVHSSAPTARAADASDATSLVGQPAPDFKLVDLGGATHTLAETAGHVVLLDFWATWCVPCHLELPHIDKLYHDQSPQGLKVFAIDINDDATKVPQYVTDNHLTLPVLLDKDSVLTPPYKVDEQPETVIIGKDGKIRNVFLGFSEDKSPAELEKAVAAAMSE
jgi:peroxiredoxin